MLRSRFSISERVGRLTGEAGAGVAVPVITAVAVDRTGAGAAGVGHAAARLHVHLPRLRQTQSAAHTQTLRGKQTNTVMRLRTFISRKQKLAICTGLSGTVFVLTSETFRISERGNYLMF